MRDRNARFENKQMIIWGNLAIIRPYWLAIIPILACFLYFTKSQNYSLGDWSRAMDPKLLDEMLHYQPRADARSGASFIYFSLAILVIALSGPAMRISDSKQYRNMDGSIIILDVSREKLIRQAAAAAQTIISQSGARQFGLVLYAGDAYLACPLTDDEASIESLIFAIDGKTVPDGGANPDAALSLVKQILDKSQIFEGDITLISDGLGITDRTHKLAKAFAISGHRLHTLLINEAAADGSIPTSNRPAMASLAHAGNGLAVNASNATDLAKEISTRDIKNFSISARLGIEWKDYGRFLLLIAAIPLLLFFRSEAL